MERKLTSEDKPYLKKIPEFVYDKNAARKNAFRFILDSAKSYILSNSATNCCLFLRKHASC